MHNPKFEEFEIDTKPYRNARQKISSFFFNEETGEIMGRTPESWGSYIICYLNGYFYFFKL